MPDVNADDDDDDDDDEFNATDDEMTQIFIFK